MKEIHHYMEYELLDKVKVVQNVSNHPFLINEEVTIFRKKNGRYDVCNKNGDCWTLNWYEIAKIDTIMISMKKAVIDTANKLLAAQNEVTTLEIKTEVIRVYPQYFWTQGYVSATMDDAYNDGMFTYYDTVTGGNTHRVYSNPNVKVKKTKKKTNMKTTSTVARTATKKTTVTAPVTKTIGKTKALELMENSKGHFFTATFIDKKDKVRVMNCQYLKDQSYSKLGYVKVKEAIKAKADKEAADKARKSKKKIEADSIRQVNLQTLKHLRIGGNSYKIK